MAAKSKSFRVGKVVAYLRNRRLSSIFQSLDEIPPTFGPQAG